MRPRARQRGTTASPTARRPCTRVCSVPEASASRTRRRDAATPARKSTNLLDRIAAYFDEAGELTADEIRLSTFRPKRGKKAYMEGPVDAYLGRAVEILLAVD